MSNYTVGRVAVGLKRIEIRAITAEIFIRPLLDGPCPHIQFNGREHSIGNKVRAVGFEEGDRATLFWCARGESESHWAAGYNHRTGRFGVSEFGIAPETARTLCVNERGRRIDRPVSSALGTASRP